MGVKMKDKTKKIISLIAVTAIVLALSVADIYFSPLGVEGLKAFGLSKTVETVVPVTETTTVTETSTTETTTQPEPDVIKMVRPEKTVFTTDSKTISFAGKVKPGQALKCDGKAVEVGEDGAFSFDTVLQIGVNTITFEYNGQKTVYKITYSVKLIKSVTPSSSVKAAGGTSVDISVKVLNGASVSVTVGGKKISLSKGNNSEDSANDSNFDTYIGSYKLPASTTEVQTIGTVCAYATYNGIKETKYGGKLYVNAMEFSPPTVDPPVEEAPNDPDKPTLLSPYENNGSSEKAQMIVVKQAVAEYMPGKEANGKSIPTVTPQVKGTVDYISGTATYEKELYYILRSGYKILASDATVLNGFVLPSNRLVSYQTTNTSSTNIFLITDWQVPINVELKPQSYYKGFDARPCNVTSFTAEYVDFVFSYTPSATGDVSVMGSDIVRSAEWVNVGATGSNGVKTSTLRLHLWKKGVFYGYKISYENNRLKIAINNKPLALSSAVVMLDPGHGGKQPGAVGVGGILEKNINLSIATKVRSILESKGIKVYMTRTGDTDLELDTVVTKTRNSDADVFVSIHCNSTTTSNYSGVETYYYKNYSFNLATEIGNELVAFYRGIYKNNQTMYDRIVPKNYGVVRQRVYRVTRIEECPSVLIECGYLSNATEYGVLTNGGYQQQIAQAIANGIVKFLQNN